MLYFSLEYSSVNAQVMKMKGVTQLKAGWTFWVMKPL